MFCVGQSVLLVELADAAVDPAGRPCRVEQFTQDSFVLVSKRAKCSPILLHSFGFGSTMQEVHCFKLKQLRPLEGGNSRGFLEV